MVIADALLRVVRRSLDLQDDADLSLLDPKAAPERGSASRSGSNRSLCCSRVLEPVPLHPEAFELLGAERELLVSPH